MEKKLAVLAVTLSFIIAVASTPSLAFQSDELLVEDEEFGLEGSPSHGRSSPPPTTQTRRRYSDSDSDSKIQFPLEHAFGDSDFSPAGSFSARLKTWSHGPQVIFRAWWFWTLTALFFLWLLLNQWRGFGCLIRCRFRRSLSFDFRGMPWLRRRRSSSRWSSIAFLLRSFCSYASWFPFPC